MLQLQCIPLILGFLGPVALTRLSITCLDVMGAMVAPSETAPAALADFLNGRFSQWPVLLAWVPLVDDFLTGVNFTRLTVPNPNLY